MECSQINGHACARVWEYTDIRGMVLFYGNTVGCLKDTPIKVFLKREMIEYG